MKLIIDDTRPVPYGFILARSVQEALNDKHQLFEQISIDYNLGYRKENGLDFLQRFIVEGYYVPQINLHSDDLFGVYKIENEIKSILIEEKKQTIKITKISF